MKKLLFIAAVIGIAAMVAFKDHACQHVFVSVVKDSVKIVLPVVQYDIRPIEYSWPSGIQEGQEIVCVKCFDKRKQVLDYGQPQAQPHMPIWGSTINARLWQGSGVTTGPDSCVTRSLGKIVLDADTLLILK